MVFANGYNKCKKHTYSHLSPQKKITSRHPIFAKIYTPKIALYYYNNINHLQTVCTNQIDINKNRPTPPKNPKLKRAFHSPSKFFLLFFSPLYTPVSPNKSSLRLHVSPPNYHFYLKCISDVCLMYINMYRYTLVYI